MNPIWSAGGERIVFRSDREGPPDIHEKALEGAGNQEVVFASPGVQHPLDVSLDNQRLIYLEENSITRADLWMLPLTGERKPFLLLRTPFEERDAVFSPDGRWIAFESDESGAPEIYVTPVDAVGSRRPVSLTGGQTPRWRRDGKELFYMAPNGGLMSMTEIHARSGAAGCAGTAAVRGGRSRGQRHLRRVTRRATVSRQHRHREGPHAHYGRPQWDVGAAPVEISASTQPSSSRRVERRPRSCHL